MGGIHGRVRPAPFGRADHVTTWEEIRAWSAKTGREVRVYRDRFGVVVTNVTETDAATPDVYAFLPGWPEPPRNRHRHKAKIKRSGADIREAWDAFLAEVLKRRLLGKL